MVSPSLEQASQTAQLPGNGGRMVLIQIKGGKKTHRSELWVLYVGLSKSAGAKDVLCCVPVWDTCMSIATGVCPENSPRPPGSPLI